MSRSKMCTTVCSKYMAARETVWMIKAQQGMILS